MSFAKLHLVKNAITHEHMLKCVPFLLHLAYAVHIIILDSTNFLFDYSPNLVPKFEAFQKDKNAFKLLFLVAVY